MYTKEEYDSLDISNRIALAVDLEKNCGRGKLYTYINRSLGNCMETPGYLGTIYDGYLFLQEKKDFTYFLIQTALSQKEVEDKCEELVNYFGNNIKLECLAFQETNNGKLSVYIKIDIITENDTLDVFLKLLPWDEMI